jgi:HlyD family secretion protein
MLTAASNCARPRRPGPEARYRLERLDRGAIRDEVAGRGTVLPMTTAVSAMRVAASVEEPAVGGVAVGETATIRLADDPGRVFSGIVSEVRPVPGKKQGQVEDAVLVDVANREYALRPGMTATVSIEVERRDDVLRLPTLALTYVPPGMPPTDSVLAHEGRVFVLDHGRPRPVRMTLGAQDLRHVQVVAGPLAEGDAVIVGEYALTPE